MNAMSAPFAMPLRRVLQVYLQEARSECLRYLRYPGFLIPTLCLPTLFYLMFGVVLGHGNGAEAPRYLLAAYATFGVMAPGMFGFGVALAMERDGGLLMLKRALPMPPAAYLAGKMVMAMLVAAMVVTLLLAIAVSIAHVPLAPVQMLRLFGVELFGVLPFCAFGLLLGTLVKGQAGPALVNMIYLPMALLSGLWFPLSNMPKLLQRLAPVWPSYHLNQLSLAAVGFDRGPVWTNALALCAFTACFLLLAARRLRSRG
jgi:ABC-2 type transport system permease protein